APQRRQTRRLSQPSWQKVSPSWPPNGRPDWRYCRPRISPKPDLAPIAKPNAFLPFSLPASVTRQISESLTYWPAWHFVKPSTYTLSTDTGHGGGRGGRENSGLGSGRCRVGGGGRVGVSFK